MRAARFIRPVLAALLAAPMVAAPPVIAGTESSEVTFRLTLQGPVNPEDGFLIDVRCDGGDFCNGVDAERFVYICAPPVIVDTVLCEADSFEFMVGIPPQLIEYHLYRVTDLDQPEKHPTEVMSGPVPVHEGPQVISLGYVYPGGSPAPALPDTAMPGG